MSALTNRRLFVTGGTGSFGQAFVRRALADGAARVVVFSRDELKQATLLAEVTDSRLRCFVGDVRDRARVALALRGCDTVVHAAAMKRIETCEADPTEAQQTNIGGSINVALAAIDAGVERAVLLSTDKAPAAHTLYGMTKAVAERIWVQSNTYAAGRTPCTKLACTRYGNVLGSRGSVLARWRQEKAAGQPLTLTDVRATRFWMTLTMAVDLVVAALGEMQGGEIFVPRVPSAAVLDLARAVAETDGVYAPGHVEVGLRPGERLHETLISEDEMRHTTVREGRYVIQPEAVVWRTPRPLGPPAGCTAYRSDTNPDQWTVEELRRLIA